MITGLFFLALIIIVGYIELVTISYEYVEPEKPPVHIHTLYNLTDHFKYEELEETESA